MTAALSRADLFLTRLLALTHAEDALPCLCVRAYHTHHIKAVELAHPALIVPLEGSKRIREQGDWLQIQPGELLLVPGARRLDVENIPDAQSGRYTAIAVTLEPHLIEAARQLLASSHHEEPGPVVRLALAPLGDALSNWLDKLQAGDMLFACHAMTGVVLRLCALGYGGILAPRTPNLAERIGAMVAADPARDWRSPDIEQALAMSGASLRRQLAATGTSLRETIANARLARALTLLQSTRLPVKSVAQRVGYSSPASFSKRFAARYGVDPSRVSAA